tara:strand:- start:169 stop:573 length:405 start_codon:yes stop_codon:yes gene_type:complete
LTAAYGRKHTTLEEAQADFNKDKDFQTPSGSYTNKSDLAKMYPHLERIRVRFNRLEDTGYVLFKAELKPEPEPKPKPKGRPTVTWNGEEYAVPSDREIEQMLWDTAEAIDGCRVEPDGTCPHGAPSWLLQLGMI